MSNAYALPSGEIVNLPDHCTDALERFTLRGGALVYAVRVCGDGDEDSAKRIARELPAPRKVA